MRPPHTKAARRAAARSAVALAAWLALAAGAGGCAGSTAPAAWDKAFLAKPEMTMSWNPLAAKYDQHIYDSKEGAAGGYGVGGGGCGCY